ncbi:Synaptobrevin [Carpediemonas membranifera]|uniref:Synaptobrevin n=1 Tax=Carpediemonas membranifera TaxID=201153 RepID=A0A8J6E404_9EUKA|nr:Synaptobrevin [Carpediemonas membranifera]|eukprot:KAG9396608.1 Synaptobrevin [Carpediemonas membranifera]
MFKKLLSTIAGTTSTSKRDLSSEGQTEVVACSYDPVQELLAIAVHYSDESRSSVLLIKPPTTNEAGEHVPVASRIDLPSPVSSSTRIHLVPNESVFLVTYPRAAKTLLRLVSYESGEVLPSGSVGFKVRAMNTIPGLPYVVISGNGLAILNVHTGDVVPCTGASPLSMAAAVAGWWDAAYPKEAYLLTQTGAVHSYKLPQGPLEELVEPWADEPCDELLPELLLTDMTLHAATARDGTILHLTAPNNAVAKWIENPVAGPRPVGLGLASDLVEVCPSVELAEEKEQEEEPQTEPSVDAEAKAECTVETDVEAEPKTEANVANDEPHAVPEPEAETSPAEGDAAETPAMEPTEPAETEDREAPFEAIRALFLHGSWVRWDCDRLFGWGYEGLDLRAIGQGVAVMFDSTVTLPDEPKGKGWKRMFTKTVSGLKKDLDSWFDAEVEARQPAPAPVQGTAKPPAPSQDRVGQKLEGVSGVHTAMQRAQQALAERGEKLNEMSDRSQQLADQASGFAALCAELNK